LNDAAAASAGLQSFFMAGFECASQRRADGRRLDLLEATGHARHALADYALAMRHSLKVARDGLRWHRIETAPGRYDWSSAEPMARAAGAVGMQVIWDLCHYGYPDDIDIWSAAFPERFARFSAAAARFLTDHGDHVPYFCPINEMSYWAWAGGDTARFNPNARRRGPELKLQLARAAIAATAAIREVAPNARFIVAEPAIHVAPKGAGPKASARAENYRLAQFEAHDMLIGRRNPELGGSPETLDIVGMNFYPENQWFLDRGTIPLGHYAYKPFREMLIEASGRYGRPVIVSETGAEGTARPAWLHYVADEVAAAVAAGAQVEGVCLYPVLDYPGWENNRLCRVGLFGEADANGRRAVSTSLAAELERQAARFARPEAAEPNERVVALRRGAS
jgi:beta-glucosidase/6-phospho-beta-glucosidase/beta-galactosidase